MKYLIPLTLLLTGGCIDSSDIGLLDPSTLKLHAGQKVKTTVAFYSGCEGVIVDHARYVEGKERPRYSISFYCPNIGRLKDDVFILETSLVPLEDK